MTIWTWPFTPFSAVDVTIGGDFTGWGDFHDLTYEGQFGVHGAYAGTVKRRTNEIPRRAGSR